MSAAQARTRSPLGSRVAATSARLSALRAATTTFAPCASADRAHSLPRAALERLRTDSDRDRTLLLDLAPGGVYRAAAVTCGAGGLLHHRFTLTGSCEPAVCSLWHCPAGRPGLRLATTLPCGVRTFLGEG